MGKYGSLIFQVAQRIEDLKMIGKSKHAAKRLEKQRCAQCGEKWNPSRVPGIYSYRTADAYRAEGMQFVKWERKNHPDFKILGQIPLEHLREYLEEGIIQGKSAWTIACQRSALAKIFGVTGPEIKEDIPPRCLKDRIKGKLCDLRHFNPENHLILRRFSKACGLRDHEIRALTPDKIFTNRHNQEVLVRVDKGKGGKRRIAHVMENEKNFVLELAKAASEAGFEKVFQNVPKDAPVHTWRHDYATARYEELREEGMEPKNARLGVSRDLGHNRLDVTRSYIDTP